MFINNIVLSHVPLIDNLLQNQTFKVHLLILNHYYDYKSPVYIRLSIVFYSSIKV